MQVRADRWNGAVVSMTTIASEIAILLNIQRVSSTAADVRRLSEMAVCDSMPVMRLPARLLLAVLAVSLASLTPVLPGESVPPVQRKASCCADMNMDAGQRCPINPGSTSSAACCTGPSVCLLLYFGNGDAFSAQTQMIRSISISNDRVTTRSQRPPVPPPRSVVS
jgi:hypothetical protein